MTLFLGGTWATCHAGLETPLMIAGDVTQIGSRTGRGWQIAQLGLGKMPLVEEMARFTWSRIQGITTL